MASVAAQGQIASAIPAKVATGGRSEEEQGDHDLARFFYAACAALILSAIQGVVQRLPGIEDWLSSADYGGHMVTNLAHTHITIVGAGTISLTGLIYYVLPRVTKRPLYSKALTNVSFWATLIGVFGFYLAMLSIGTYEGAMVHAGWPYDAARNWMGAWHKAPMAITAAIMGLGYWTFVANVYMTVGRASGERKINPGKGASDSEFLLAKFFVVSATGLLFGTIQGVYQVLPWSLDWLRATGDAGKLIDPMSHTHMNLVGGVSVGIAGLLYFFLPKMLDRPIYSMKLALFSFWFMVVGVFSFYISAVSLGYIEGSMVLTGMTAQQAQDSVGLWHTGLLGVTASIMGIGFWAFIANILLTLKQKVGPQAPPDRTLRFFIGLSVISLLLGTIQGVIQVLGPVAKWLKEALPSSYFVTPLAHAQLNMVGFAIITLMAMTIYLLPRILGKEVLDPKRGRRALSVIAVGVACTYAVYFGVGLLESIAIHNGASASEARLMVAGRWGRYALFVGAQGIVGVGYIMLFRYVASVIGKETIRAYYRTFWGRMRSAGQQSVHIHSKALPTSTDVAQRRAAVGLALELLFVGIGWFFSGRPFVGIMALSGAVGYTSVAYVVIAIAGNSALLPFLIGMYYVAALFSALGCYRSYMRDARLHLAARA
ncbi:MAG: cbb3-type cytochrome c oxidase subunit I [Chloroflexi bacterium]|nr:cbb3-type cytochrome c oxidase subunit I [Chloroflexota bacterium]